MLNLIFAGDSQFLPSLQAVNPSRGHDGRHHAGAWADLGMSFAKLLTELDDGKIYRQPLYLMLKTSKNHGFSLKLKPIH